MTICRIRTIFAALAAAVIILASQATASWAVIPGSVSPIINNTSGSPNFSFHAVAAGWSKGTIKVSYTMYDGPSKTGPWAKYYSDSHTCTSSTSCSTPTTYGVCTNGWYRLVATANGPGGNAENNGAEKIVYIHGTISTVAPESTVTPDSISSECKVHYEPI